MTENEQRIISTAINILNSHLKVNPIKITSCEAVINFLRLQLENKEREVFGVLFLNQQSVLISYEEMFLGTINLAPIYPREIAKRALLLNATGIILTHNHPSGFAEPSRADISATEAVSEALDLFSIRVLDHIIIGGGEHVSFNERGLL